MPKTTTCECGKMSVFFRRQESRHYCKSCFFKSIEKKFRKTVGKYKLVQRGDRVAVALSGGKDSSVVLYMMHQLMKKRDVEIFAVSIDEGIASYRPQTLEQASLLCKRLDIKHYVYSFEKELGKSLDKRIKNTGDACTYCGVGRRYILNTASRELKATKLCMGHNLDDEAQSVLMNFLRGDLLRAGRMGVLTNESADKGFIPRIKPLRFIAEREVALYAILKKLPFSDDECPNIGGMRHQVRDFLNNMENQHAGISYSLLESYDKIAPNIKQSVQYKSSLLPCTKCGEPSSRKVCKTCELWK